MSDVGIMAAGYQRFREYAEVVDRLLLDLKLGNVPTQETIRPVVQLFEELENDETSPAMVHVVRLLIRSRSALPTGKFKTIASQLRARQPSNETVQDLERVAAVLDDERAAISARLQGAKCLTTIFKHRSASF